MHSYSVLNGICSSSKLKSNSDFIHVFCRSSTFKLRIWHTFLHRRIEEFTFGAFEDGKMAFIAHNIVSAAISKTIEALSLLGTLEILGVQPLTFEMAGV